MPLLICSTDGVHRVGIVSLLILAIVGRIEFGQFLHLYFIIIV
jgi:hypothetical protein